MRTKKRTALLMAASLLAVMLAGCGGSPSGENTSAPDQSSATQSPSAAQPSNAPSQESHDPVSITVTYAGGDETATAAMENLLNDFNATYDWIDVIQDASTAGSYEVVS